jgi:hypothetical protein
MRRAKLYHSVPIKPVGDIEQAALAPLPPANPWVLAAMGLAAGFLGLRWLLQRRIKRNPAWTSEESKLGDQWSVWTPDGEFIGYVLRMPGYFAALNDNGAVIGKMGSLIEAEALVYGNWSYRFGSFDTLVANPPWRIEWLFDIGMVWTGSAGGSNIGQVTEQDGKFRADTGRHSQTFDSIDEAAAWLYSQHAPSEASQRSIRKAKREIEREEMREERIYITPEEVRHRILVNLGRQKKQSKTYRRDPSVVRADKEREGYSYHTSVMRDVTFTFPKPLSEDQLTRKVKASKSRVLKHAKQMARDGEIYGYCHKVPVVVPAVERDARGRKVMTAKKAKRRSKTYCYFATHGPGGELGLFKAGEHKVPEGIQTRLHRGDTVYIKGAVKPEPLYVSRFSFDFEGQLQAYVQKFGPAMTVPSPKESGEWVRVEQLQLATVPNPKARKQTKVLAAPEITIVEHPEPGDDPEAPAKRAHSFYVGDEEIGGAKSHASYMSFFSLGEWQKRGDPNRLIVFYIDKKGRIRTIAKGHGRFGRAYPKVYTPEEAAQLAYQHWSRDRGGIGPIWHNPEQTAFRFSAGPSYIVKERKPKGRGRDGRMFYEEWKTVSNHDTLESAKKAATVHIPKGGSRRWLRQRAIFLRGKRVSNGPFLLREFKDLPEVPR